MALKHHPDKNPNNPEATEKVSQILPRKLLVMMVLGCLQEYVKFFSTFESLEPGLTAR